MSYRIIATCLPHGVYTPSINGASPKVQLTLLFQLQFLGDPNDKKNLKDLPPYRHWTQNLQNYLRQKFPDPANPLILDFEFSKISNTNPLTLTPIATGKASLTGARLDAKLWESLFYDDTSVCPREIKAPGMNKVETYCHDETTQDLRSRMISLARAPRRNTEYRRIEGLSSLGENDYMPLPDLHSLEEEFGLISPFLGPKPNECDKCRSQQFEELATAQGVKSRLLIIQDLERLRRYKPAHADEKALVKAETIQAIYNQYESGQLTADCSVACRGVQAFSITAVDQAARLNYTKALLFHRPHHYHQSDRVISTEAGPLPNKPQNHDFHQRLAAFANSPVILRPLGLAFDLEVKLSGDVSNELGYVQSKTETFLRDLVQPLDLKVPFTAFQFHSVSKKTANPVRYFLIGDRKDAPTQETQVGMWNRYGMLDISNRDDYALVNTDPAAAILRAVQPLAEKPPPQETDDEPGEQHNPMRTSGIAFIVKERDRRTQQDLDRTKQQDPTKPVFLYSEDLLLGYRVDVQRWQFSERVNDPEVDDWRSLALRTSEYRVLDPKENDHHKKEKIYSWRPSPVDETLNEGFIQMSYAKSADAAAKEYQANSALFRWEGWSLGAPMPLKKHDKDSDRVYDPDHPDEAPEQSGLDAHHTRKRKSLPKLEFVDGYRLRLRSVDIGGNSYSLEEAPENDQFVIGQGLDAKGVPVPFIHERYEPVGIPEVMLTKPFRPSELPGEQMTHLVIRGKGTEEANAVSQRYLVPPRVTHTFAEMHGVREGFDPPRGAFVDPAFNPNGTYLKMHADGSFWRACDEWGNCSNSKKEKPKPEENNPVYEFTESAMGYPQCPFFPDPAARVVRILMRTAYTDSPVTLGEPMTFDFYGNTGTWPNVIPFGIQLKGASDKRKNPFKMEWLRRADPNARRRGDGAGDILEVTLNPSYTVNLLIHCGPTFEDLPISGQQIQPVTTGQVSEEQKEKDQRYQSLRQARSFVFTSALVREVLRAAESSAQRKPSFNPFRHWLFSSPLVLHLVHAVEKPLAPPLLKDIMPVDLKVGETVVKFMGSMSCHRRSTGRLEIFAEWEEPDDDPKKTDYSKDPLRAKESISYRSLTTKESEGDQAEPVPMPDEAKYDFKDTKYREIRVLVEATSRFTSYYPDASGDQKRFVVSTPEESYRKLEILSRARPALPVVNSVMPAFRWETKHESKKIISRERKSVARVWLERTWFSSGADEKLGIVLFPAKPPAGCVPETMDDLVSRWAMDPLWDSAQIRRRITRDDFSGYRDRDPSQNLKIEQSNCPVDVVAYDVEYSFERHMWYADVEVSDNGSYFPFVQFAVARYQRHSLPGIELSAVVQTAPVQVFPYRKATVVTGKKREWSVKVEGVTFTPSAERPVPNSFRATLVERPKADQSDTGWLTSLSGSQPIQVPLDYDDRSKHWINTVVLPKRRPGTRYALLIEEFETWNTDAADRDLNKPMLATKRLVYSDRVELTEL